jgi:hypothetical protein
VIGKQSPGVEHTGCQRKTETASVPTWDLRMGFCFATRRQLE